MAKEMKTLNGYEVVDGAGRDRIKKLEEELENGSFGTPGASAYEIAVANGFEGDEEAWLASLNGTPGTDGADGKSAYAYAVEGGYEGSESEFTEKLAEEALIGTTDEITPTQISAATSEGRAIAIQHTDSTYGDIEFSNFTYSKAFNAVVSCGIVRYGNNFMLFELLGALNTDAWILFVTQLAQSADIPTTLPNPSALTINGVTYDGSEAVSVDSREFVFNVTGDAENGYTSDKTYAEITAALVQLRPISGYLTDSGYGFANLRCTLAQLADGNLTFSASLGASMVIAIAISSDDQISVDISTPTMTINGNTWDLYKSVDFTDTINAMIDAKLGVIENGTY